MVLCLLLSHADTNLCSPRSRRVNIAARSQRRPPGLRFSCDQHPIDGLHNSYSRGRYRNARRSCCAHTRASGPVTPRVRSPQTASGLLACLLSYLTYTSYWLNRFVPIWTPLSTRKHGTSRSAGEAARGGDDGCGGHCKGHKVT